MKTVEIIFQSAIDKNGDAQIVPGRPIVHKIVQFLHRPGPHTWVMTESGDIWPVRRHQNQAKANYFALGGA